MSLSSDKYLCVREEKSVAIVDLKSKSSPNRIPIAVTNATMNPTSQTIALAAGTKLTLYHIDTSARAKEATLDSPIVYWNWINPKTVGIVTATAVYNWSLEGTAEPTKVFDRDTQGKAVQVLSYTATDDSQWHMVSGIYMEDGRPRGSLQVHSARGALPILPAPAGCFAKVLLDGRTTEAHILCLALFNPQTNAYTLKLAELVANRDANSFSKEAPMQFRENDFPVSMVADPRLSIVYVVSQQGWLTAYEITAGKPIAHMQVSQVAMFASVPHSADGFVAVDVRGGVRQIAVDRRTLVPYIVNRLQDPALGISLARRFNLEGADHILKEQFARLIQAGQTNEALELAISSPQLRNAQTIAALKASGGPILQQYFQSLLQKGSLNAVESLELCQLLLTKGQQGLDFIKDRLAENKLENSEALGDALRQANIQLALSVYLRAECHQKAIGCLLQIAASMSDDAKAQEYFKSVFEYVRTKNVTPDYASLLGTLIAAGSPRAKDFALLLLKHEDGPKIDIEQTATAFFTRGDIKSATNILLEYFRERGSRPEDARLQTMLLSYNVRYFPQIARAILESEDPKLEHFNKAEIANLCETAGLFRSALELYTDVRDIKRVIMSATSTPSPDLTQPFLVQYFGNIAADVGYEVLRDLVRSQNPIHLQVAVEVAKAWTEHFGTQRLIQLFEEAKSVRGLYFFLQGFVQHTSDPEVVMKFVEAASNAGAQGWREIEAICRDHKHYDPVQMKEYLLQKEASRADPRPLIQVCDRFQFYDDLVNFLIQNNRENLIETLVQRKNQGAAPQIVGILIDVGQSDEFVKRVIAGVRIDDEKHPDWIERMTDVLEKRNRLRIFRQWLEERQNEGSTDPKVYTALAKLYVDSGNARHFLETNNLYDPISVGAFCASRDPSLAVVVYRRGKCDDELIDLTNRNGFFKEQARYLVERMSDVAWAKVLSPENPYRRNVIDQVVAVAIPESHNPEHLQVAVRAFIDANIPHELIELLERIMLGTGESHFQDNRTLQNLLISTACRADKSRVMDYLKRLNNYDVTKIATICLDPENKLYEEAFYVYKKAKQWTDAAKVLIEYVGDLPRASEFAESTADTPEVWSLLANAQLHQGLLADAMKSFIRAEDATKAKEVIAAINAANVDELYVALVPFLKMARGKVKDSAIDNEIVYAYARTNELGNLEEFVSGTNSARLLECGDRVFAEGRYQAGRIIFAQAKNYAKLAMCLVKLELWNEAVEVARKANHAVTWKFVCFACVDAREFKNAQICALRVVTASDSLEELVRYYENLGYFNELIQVLEAAVNLERPHPGIFTQLGIAYAKYQEEKFMEFVRNNHSRANLGKLTEAAKENFLWAEAVFLCQQYEQYDTAIQIMMEHSPQAWQHNLFKELACKVSNTDYLYRAIDFYLQEHPLLLNELLIDLEKKLDHGRAINRVGQKNHALIQAYLQKVQHNGLQIINDALNDLYIEEENHTALRNSIENYQQFDQNQLANRLKNHELLEFRRIAAQLYRINQRFENSIELSKKDELWQDAIDTAAASKKPEVVEELLRFFVSKGLNHCFSAMLYTCFDYITPDVVLELAWRHNLTNFAMPYMIQTFAHYNNRLLAVEKHVKMHQEEKKEEEKAKAESAVTADASIMLNATAANAPLMLTYAPGAPMGGMPAMGMSGMGGMPGMGMGGMGGMPGMGMGGMGGMPGMGGF